MSRGRNNNVRGPTSALTEFLRESGITPTTIARRNAAGAAQRQGQQNDAQAAPSTATSSNQQAEASSSSTRAARASNRAGNRRTSGYGSDNLDDDEADEEEQQQEEEAEVEQEEETQDTPAPSKKRKLTKAAEAKLKAAEKKKAKGKGKKGKGSDDEDDDDPYTSLSKSMWTGSSKPTAGSFENCARCKKQFTVTKYTMAANPPPGWLCHACAKSSGQDPYKKRAAPRKRNPPRDKRDVVHFVENRLPSMVNLCIKILTKYIDDVESLGDIGSVNMEAIAKAMAKNRSLTPQNAGLFYNASNSKLVFYDATNITSKAFESLVYMNPNLTSLRLDFCGQLDDAAFKLFISNLPALERIELLGPFLVRVPSWKAFFQAHKNLQGFLIHQSPRFDLECLQTLISCCPGLKELRLREVGKMSDEFLDEIATLGPNSLTYLDLGCPAKSCSDIAMIELLQELGAGLEHLDVAKHDALTDKFLDEGLAGHTGNLSFLGISHLPELTDDGVAAFFSEWENTPLVGLDASRNPDLKGSSLTAIVKHSGKTLQTLNINGWKDVEEDALKEIGRKGKELRRLDVGFCRNVDDFVVKDWLEGEKVKGSMKGGLKNLTELKVWGCNRVTAACSRRFGLVIHGVESHVIKTR